MWTYLRIRVFLRLSEARFGDYRQSVSQSVRQPRQSAHPLMCEKASKDRDGVARDVSTYIPTINLCTD